MKRFRAPNFTTAEVMHLLQLVEKYPIIENKKTDGATAKEKHVAWQNLAAEYNSQTNFSPRTADNLLSCYKNQKIKVKKMYSNEKMTIKAPLLLTAVEEHGQDWDRVAQATEESSQDCQNTFQHLVKTAKKEEVLYKKEIQRTGGGPPPQPSCSNDPVIQKVKTLIGPALEGMYTVYDGDADFMKEQQASVSFENQIVPIEVFTPDVKALSPVDSLSQIENASTPVQAKRLNIIKSKIDPSLESMRKGKKKANVSQSFQALADDKTDLVKAQKKLAEYQIEHQQILIKMAQQQLDFEGTKQKMELEFLKEKHELELSLLRNKQI